MIALVAAAWAASVAVVDFDGYGVSTEDARIVSEDLRVALLARGVLDPLSGEDMADGASRGQDAALRRARELVAEGRRAMAAEDPDAAVAAVEEALALHATARSAVGHREELADAWVLFGSGLLELGRGGEAYGAFTEAVGVYPGYAAARGSGVSPGVAELLRAADAARAEAAREDRDGAEVARIAEALQVDFVVTGWVSGDGRMRALLWRNGRAVGDAEGILSDVPPPSSDATVREVARVLTSAAAPPKQSVEPAEAAPRPANEVPVTDRWWFWTGIVAVVGGAGAAVGIVLYEPAPEVVEEPDTYTVAVALPP